MIAYAFSKFLSEYTSHPLWSLVCIFLHFFFVLSVVLLVLFFVRVEF